MVGDGNAVVMGAGETKDAAWLSALEHGGTRAELEATGHRIVPIDAAAYVKIYNGDNGCLAQLNGDGNPL